MPEASIEDIADQFEEFGAEFNDEQLEKLKEYCHSYHVDASCIVHEWMAFSSTRKMLESWESLETFNREWLPKKLRRVGSTPKSTRKPTPKVLRNGFDNEDDEDNVLSNYNTPNSKVTNSLPKRQITPDNSSLVQKRFIGSNGMQTSVGAVTPDMLSPGGAVRSGKFSSRTNAGSVVSKFGNTDNVSWKGESCPCAVNVIRPGLSSRKKYMFQKQSDKIQVLNDSILDQCDLLQRSHNIEEFSNAAVSSQGTVAVAGRICCDAIGRLNGQSVILEGAHEHSKGRCVKVDLSQVAQYSLFPGQIIAMQGVNNTGQLFSVQKIYESIPLPLSEINCEEENAGMFRMLVATGPYALSDSLDYSPLSDLIKYINRDRPEICVLMGPFVDVKNSSINSGDVEESFDDLFTRHMHHLGSTAKTLGCKVVVVPSYRDIHHCHSVYPQPPFTISDFTADGLKKLESELDFKNHLEFVTDPCTLEVNGVTIGLTSTDILMHMSKSETSVGSFSGLDRLGRLTQHILRQHSYYPLYPVGDGVNLDLEMWEETGRMEATPHVLLVPSDLKAFIKDVDSCCCINPGRLTMGQSGGTFAQLVIDTKKFKTTKSPAASISAQIVKV